MRKGSKIKAFIAMMYTTGGYINLYSTGAVHNLWGVIE